MEVVHALLSAGAQVDWANAEGASPLWVAAVGGNAEVVRVLLDAGAQVDLVNAKGASPLWAEAREEAMFDPRVHEEVALVLLSRGARLGARARDGRTVLDVCSQGLRAKLLPWQLELGKGGRWRTSRG